MVGDLGLEDVRSTERADVLIDPHDPGAVAEISGMIDRYAAKATGLPDLEPRARALRERLADVGVQEATILMIVGRRASD